MKVLVTTDGSECSAEAARFLNRFAFSEEDSITVLHVVPAIPFHDNRESYYSGLRQIRQEIAPRIVDAAIGQMSGCRAQIEPEVLDGEPDAVILQAAEERGSDLIVMGARGIRGIRSLFIGSVSRAVAIASERPLLITKPGRSGTAGPLQVLFATDGSDAALDTGRLLAGMPFPEGTAVTVLHVTDSGYMDIPDRMYPEMDERIKTAVAGMAEVEYAHAEQIIERSRDAIGKAFGAVSGLVKVGNPEDEIVQAARSAGADIIALGGAGMRGMRGVLGSVARSVLGHADRPVLIGKGPRQ